jgi:diaminopimelate decarboxylase
MNRDRVSEFASSTQGTTPVNHATDAALLTRAHAALNAKHPGSRAFWFYDLDHVRARAAHLKHHLNPLRPRIHYALKANGLPALIRVLREAGLGADAGSLGELELARACGFPFGARTLSGNGRTPEEAAWVARHGVECVSADFPDELHLLEREAAAANVRLNVALRVNPGIVAGGHPHIETGHATTKFGMSVRQALDAWRASRRWPHLELDGVHLHVGSQVEGIEPFVDAATLALDLVAAAKSFGHAIASVNLGGGFSVDYGGTLRDLDLGALASALAALPGAAHVKWCFEPGRWLVAAAGTLVAEVLWDKHRDEEDGTRRFVVLAAGMNDLLRPALYGARHRIVPLSPRAEESTPADVVGPVCESSDRFAAGVSLPPLMTGDLVALLDAGAYGEVMSSAYNGRGRLAEVVHSGGELHLAAMPEPPRSAVVGGLEDLPPI